MKIGFIGAGNMARAIARGLAHKGICAPGELACISATGRGAALMAEQSGAEVCQSREELIKRSDIVILAFKPQHLDTITPSEAEQAAGKLVISVLAGRTLESLKAAFPSAANCIRVMPNTPSQIGKGVSTFCFSKAPTTADAEAVRTVLQSLGSAYEVAEAQLHIATAINGCGPAFYFRIAQLIGEIADKHGLDRELAINLACETGIGSLELLRREKRDPQQLIDEVVSPNGVTHALLTSLDRNGFPQTLDTAMGDAVERSKELARPS